MWRTSVPWRLAVRAGLCLPRAPTRAVTSPCMISCNTCSPTATENANNPSLADLASSVSETVTCSGVGVGGRTISGRSVDAIPLAWWSSSVCFGQHLHYHKSAAKVGGTALKIYELRDNLSVERSSGGVLCWWTTHGAS